MFERNDFDRAVARKRCREDHLFFTRYFFRARTNNKFYVNWHHHIIARALDDVLAGRTLNLIINVAPGSSKTEEAVINFMARGLALNPRARFMHLSYSDDLALLNSQTARELVRSSEFQELYPLEISDDTQSRKRWNVRVGDNDAGGVYATSLGGQVTGFRAGLIQGENDGFSGAIVIDDPVKPEDAFSSTAMERANRQLLTTVKSRRANPYVPIVMIMQRISDDDPTAFMLANKEFQTIAPIRHIVIPAIIDDDYVGKSIPEDLWHLIDDRTRDNKGRYSYWQMKEPIADLAAMESGGGTDASGNAISRFVYAAQYDQNPTIKGGNMIKSAKFFRYKVLPKITYRKIFVDSAQKTKERNDWSVLLDVGKGTDGKLYILDLLRGKWESPELRRRARAFWDHHKSFDHETLQIGQLRAMAVEDKSSGTDLIQTFGNEQPFIPVEAIQRNVDKVIRVNDALPYIDLGLIGVPEGASWAHDFFVEIEAFKSDLTHRHDDQVDVLCDAIQDMLADKKIDVWRKLGQANAGVMPWTLNRRAT